MGSCSSSSFPLNIMVFIIPLIVVLAPLLGAASNDEYVRICSPTDDNGTADSTYHSNLRRFLSSLAAANVPASGYLADTVGSAPDTVYSAVVCRADIDAGKCRGCLQDAADVIVRECPHRKTAVVWYDHCLLRYTDRWTFPTFPPPWGDRSGLYVSIWNPANVSAADLFLFNRQVATMVSRLAAYAAYNSPSSGRMFATGEAAFTAAHPKIYGMAHCTADQPAKICQACLTGFLRVLPTWSTGRRGARILGTSCSVRYEIFPFFNISAMVSIPSPLTASAPARPPLPPSDPGKDPPLVQENKRQRGKHPNAIIVGGVVLCLIITVKCISIWRQKASKKPHPIDQRIPHTSSLPFDLTALRFATNNFSDSNKLGQGGFGVVYKGILASGQVIAVKRLSERSKQGLKELKNEVQLLAKQEHRSLVKLLGACMEEENLLVYEYVPNKSLDNFLFGMTVELFVDFRVTGRPILGRVDPCN